MKKILFSIIMMGMAMAMTAQEQGNGTPRPQRREFSPEEYWKNLQEYVTREAKLTDEEAAKFYPLLKEMTEEQRKNNGKSMWILHSFHGKENVTDAQYGEALENLLQLEVENRQIEQNYYRKFHEVMSWEKVFMVRGALSQFYREALNRFNPRRGGGRGFGPRGQKPEVKENAVKSE